VFTRIGEILTNVQAFIERGGNVLFIIFIVTFVMWLLILERLVYFRWIHPLRVKEAVERWNARSEKTSWNARKIRSMELSEISQKLNHSISMIRTLIALCTLLGLLGTVTGMIEVFDILAIVGSGNPRAMASGVSMATIPTMSGMVATLSGVYFGVHLGNEAKKKMIKVEDALK
jgi:biopolymer transport protein ExbB